MIATTTALLLAAGIGAAGSVASGAMGKSASTGAAKDVSQKGIDVGNSIDKATGQAIDAGYAGMGGANKAIDEGLSGSMKEVDQGVSGAMKEADQAVGGANSVLQTVYDTEMKNLDPYIGAGKQGIETLADMLRPGGDLMKNFDINSFYKDPSYRFRLEEGQNALARSMATKGQALSGAAAKAAARYGSGLASQEYGAAFDRFNSDRLAKYGMLSGLAGFGERANTQAINAGNNFGNQTSSNIMQGGMAKAGYNMAGGMAKAGYNMGAGTDKANISMNGNQYVGNVGLAGATQAGNAYMGGANAAAAGSMSGANALGGAIASGTNSIGQMLLLKYLLNPGGGGIWNGGQLPEPNPAGSGFNLGTLN